MKNKNIPLFEVMAMIIGEAIVSAIICGIYLIIRKFDYNVATGAALGSVVTVMNFLFLIITTNRAIDNAIADRGDGEMNEEEAAAFAMKHQAKLQIAVKTSYIVRTLSVAGALVLAFLLDDIFAVIPTLVPLLMFRPIITVSQLIKGKMHRRE